MFTPTLFHKRLSPNDVNGSRYPRERRIVSYVPATQARQEFDDMVGGIFSRMLAPWSGLDLMPRRGEGEDGSALLMPRLDVASDDKAYTMTAELPGVRPEDVTLEVKDNMLVLKGEKKQEKTSEERDVHVSERSYGSFERVMSLPEDAVVDDIKATHKDGVLTVVIPRREPEQPQARSIEITGE